MFPDEAAAIRAWLDANPAERELVEALRSGIVVDGAGDVDVDAALATVHGRMNEPASGMSHNPRRSGKVLSIESAHRWRLAAAAAVLAASIAVTFVANRGTSRSRSTTRVYATAVGQRDSVLLADGSRVVLGPVSRLDVPADYASGTHARAVTLTGDAVFEVRHDAAHPFSVRVAGVLVEDIGTTFAIESDAGAATRVSVVAGSVRLRSATAQSDTGVTLAAGDRGAVDLTGVAHAERHAAVADDIAWTTGRLTFRDAPLAQLAGELHRWYGVLLNVSDSSLVDQHVNTSFDSDQPVDSVLKTIGLMLGAKVERHGDSATITPIHGSAAIR